MAETKVILTPDIDPALISSTVFPRIKSIEIYPGDPGDDIPIQINSIPDISVVEVITGQPGKGVPAGGDTGQVLKKTGAADYATGWGNILASEVSVDAIGAIPEQDLQTTLQEVAESTTEGGTAIEVTGEADNTGATFVHVNIEKAPTASGITDDDYLLIKNASGHRKIKYSDIATGGSGGTGIRGSVSLAVSGNSGSVSGDALNVTITEGVAPTVGPGESVIGSEYLVVNVTEVTNSITGVNKTYIEGDRVQWTGNAWLRLAQTPDNIVSSFNGREGDVVPESGDYNASQVTGAADVAADENVSGNWDFDNPVSAPAVSGDSQIVLGTTLELQSPDGTAHVKVNDLQLVLGDGSTPNVYLIADTAITHTAPAHVFNGEVSVAGGTVVEQVSGVSPAAQVIDARSSVVSQLHQVGDGGSIKFASAIAPLTEFMQIEPKLGATLMKAYDSDLDLESENAISLTGTSVSIASTVGLFHNGFVVLDSDNYTSYIDLTGYAQKASAEIISGAWTFNEVLAILDRDLHLGDIQIRGEGDASFTEKTTTTPVGVYGKQIGVGSNLGDVKTETPTNGIYAEGRIITDDEVRARGSGHNVVPVGTQLERPGTPSQGGIRFNTDSGAFEGWNGITWVTLGGAESPEILKGSVDLADGGNAGIVTGDPYNSTINEGIAPTLTPGDTSPLGYVYIVEDAAESTITGSTENFKSGDYALWNGAGWSRIVKTGDSTVDSVFGRTGEVIAEAGDYSAAQVTNAADVSAANSFEEDNNFEKAITLGGRVSLDYDSVDDVLRFTFI